jgi:hypothetical protein
MQKILIVLVVLFVGVAVVDAKTLHPERFYQDRWCEGKGQSEYVLPDQTRCDCLTETNAVEFDFGHKWYEAVGQSLYYSLQTGKRGGIALIIESPDDQKYWLRLNSTILHFNLPIDTFKILP